MSNNKEEKPVNNYQVGETYEYHNEHCGGKFIVERLVVEPAKNVAVIFKGIDGFMKNSTRFEISSDIDINSTLLATPLPNKAIGESVSEKAGNYSQSFTTYSDFVKLELKAAFTAGYQESHNEMVKVITKERDTYTALSKEDFDEALQNIYNGVAIELTNILKSIGGKG